MVPAKCSFKKLWSNKDSSFKTVDSKEEQMSPDLMFSGQIFHLMFVNLGRIPNFSLLGYLEAGYLKRYLILDPKHRDINLNTPAGNQMRPSWAGKLELRPS